LTLRISVVICTFNGERFIREQLTSVISQSRPPDEIIVRDDCSSDRTAEYIQEVMAETTLPTRFYVNRQRLGPTANFASVIADSTGEVVVLCDQDDRWYAPKLKIIEDTFAKDPGLACLFTNANLVDAAGESIRESLWTAMGFTTHLRRQWDRGDQFSVLLNRNMATGATMAFRSRLKEAILPMPKNVWHDQWICLLGCALFEVVAIPAALMDYRIHSGNFFGVPPSHLAGRMKASRIARQTRADELGRFETLHQRLETIAPAHPLAELVQEKVDHLRVRLDLDARRLRRLGPVGRELLSGRYRKYASGGWSAVFDMAFSY